MPILASELPDSVKRLMSPADRKAIYGGDTKAAMTVEEAVNEADVKNESELQEQVAAFLRIREIEYIRPDMRKKSPLPEGWPDFTFAYRGLPVCWECKTPIGTLSDKQKGMAPKLIANGWRYSIIRSVQEAKEFLDNL